MKASVICQVGYIHIGVGFEVAYLYWDGKFEGQEREISDKYESHAFFVSVYMGKLRVLNGYLQRFPRTSNNRRDKKKLI